MASNWPSVNLGSLAANHRGSISIGPFGSAMKADTYTQDGVPIIRGSNISDRRAWKGEWVFISEEFANSMPRCVVRAGALVFPHRGSIGEVAIVPTDGFERYFLSTSLMKIEIDPAKANPDFVYFFFRSRDGREEILRYSSSVGTPGIGQPLESLRKFHLPLPPLAIQDAIVSVLGALDDKIDLNRRMDETLQEMARAIFKDWFVDFGPTRAKMERRAPYLAPDIWDLFPSRLDSQSKPEAWVRAPLSDFMSFRGGSQPPASEFATFARPDYVRLLQIRDFDTDAHLTYVPRTDRLRMVGADDICVGRYGSGSGEEKDSLGRLCRGLEGAINVALVAVSPLFDCREWLATYIGSGDFRRAISGGSARAVQAGFRKEDLDHIKVTRAPDLVHQAFEEIGGMVWKKKSISQAESITLSSTRDLLLPKLMTGDIRVKDAEKIAATAL